MRDSWDLISNVSCAKGFKLNRNYTSELLASSHAVLGQVSTESFSAWLGQSARGSCKYDQSQRPYTPRREAGKFEECHRPLPLTSAATWGSSWGRSRAPNRRATASLVRQVAESWGLPLHLFRYKSAAGSPGVAETAGLIGLATLDAHLAMSPPRAGRC